MLQMTLKLVRLFLKVVFFNPYYDNYIFLNIVPQKYNIQTKTI